jgi:drug/metabolite transporter (DMT)-like permease
MEEGNTMKTSLRVYIAALSNAVIVGLSFLFTKIALETTSPIDTLSYRFMVAWIILSLYMFTVRKKRQLVSKPDKKTLISLATLAIFYPTMFFSFQAFGLDYTSSAEGGIILAFSPALTALFAAIFIKEKINGVQMLFIALSILGVLYIFLMNGAGFKISGSHIIGILFLLVSCISISGYAVLARHLSVRYSPIQLTYFMVTFGFVSFNGYAIIRNVKQATMSAYISIFENGQFILAVVFLSIFATIITAFLSNYILSVLTASKMSIFSNLSTVISILAGSVFLHEEIRIHHIIGSFMIITGVLGLNMYKDKMAHIRNKKIASKAG